jgi:transcription antitermination factor NusG
MSQLFEGGISSTQWFAVWTRSRQEKVAASMLEALNIQTFLPLRSEVRQWSDRKQMIKTPLFSGYLFVRMNLAEDHGRLHVLKAPGIVGFVGNTAGPLPIPNHQIDNVRMVLGSGVEYTVGPLFKEGDRVRVIRGSLSGLEGTLIRTNSETRLVLSVDLVKRSLSVEVSRHDVELIHEVAA